MDSPTYTGWLAETGQMVKALHERSSAAGAGGTGAPLDVPALEFARVSRRVIEIFDKAMDEAKEVRTKEAEEERAKKAPMMLSLMGKMSTGQVLRRSSTSSLSAPLAAATAEHALYRLERSRSRALPRVISACNSTT